ncbi:MAG: dienelactone hydrolase family protein [Desulfobacterales bacterium]|nr:dienelactone hydrolase family protein [Desulfobacterales bacterium]
MADDLLETVEIDPNGTASALVIWLHGLGADGHDFEPVVPMLDLPASLPVRFVFPHAPVRPVSINMGMRMRAWYDISDSRVDRRVDTESLIESADRLTDLIEREKQNGFSADRILLAGFSQGGAVALHAGLRYPEALAGIAALSTYMPTADTLEAEAADANCRLPIFMAHGAMDPMIPVENGRRARQELTRIGYRVRWHEYPMMHEVCIEEIQELGKWMQEVLVAS